MLVQIFEQSANKIAHFDQRRLGQIIERADRAFRRGASRRGDMRNGAGARHVDPAMNAIDPGGTGIGHDDAGRPQHRQAADNAEPSVERMLRHLLAAGNGNLDQRVSLDAKLPRRLGEVFPHHRARDRIDRGFADGERQTGPRHDADALPPPEGYAGARRIARDPGENGRAMRHVGIVARVLDDAGLGEIGAQFELTQREGDALAGGQRDFDRIGRRPAMQRDESRPRRRRGAGASRPTPAQGLVEGFVSRDIAHGAVISGVGSRNSLNFLAGGSIGGALAPSSPRRRGKQHGYCLGHDRATPCENSLDILQS